MPYIVNFHSSSLVFAVLALMGRKGKEKAVDRVSKKPSASAGRNSAVALPSAVDAPRKKSRQELEDEVAKLQSMNYVLFSNYWSDLCQNFWRPREHLRRALSPSQKNKLVEGMATICMMRCIYPLLSRTI
jgi:hypothetical protein